MSKLIFQTRNTLLKQWKKHGALQAKGKLLAFPLKCNYNIKPMNDFIKKKKNHIAYLSLYDFHRIGHLKGAIKKRERLAI